MLRCFRFQRAAKRRDSSLESRGKAEFALRGHGDEQAATSNDSARNASASDASKKRAIMAVFESPPSFLRAFLSFIPQPSDIAQDSVRSRAAALASYALLFFLLVFALLSPPVNTVSSGLSLLVTSSLPQVFKSSFASSSVRCPSFLVLENGVPAPAGLAVCIDSTSVVAPNYIPGTLDCDSPNLALFQNSLLGISLAGPCAISLSGACSTSDSTGLVNFSALDFGSSPTGDYSVAFAISDSIPTFVSDTFTTFMPPFQGSIILTSTPPPSITPLQPVNPAPSFQVLNSSGAPAAAGIQVRAFVWNSFSNSFGNYFNPNIDEYSFGELLGDTAVTDAQGIATFSSLRLAGSSCSSIFINVTISNSVFASLSMQTNTPIPVVTSVTSISIQTITPPPGIIVTEGNPFPTPITVKLQCNSAGSCANRRVYASFDSFVGNRVRQVQFSSFFKAPLKLLYNSSASTDSNGVANFAALQFSVSGLAGSFQISFVCDGIYSAATLNGMVTSTVQYIFFNGGNVTFTDVCGNFQTNLANVSDSFSYADSLNVISSAAQSVSISLNLNAYSSSFNPLPGKTANVALLSATPGLDFQCTQVPIVTATDGSFWVNISFSPYVNGKPFNGSTANLVIGIDQTYVTVPFLFLFNSSYQSYCGVSSVLTPNPSFCPNGGFITIFQGVYQSESMTTWTPWFPGNWSSARAFSLNFTLNSLMAPLVCNSTQYSNLLVPTAH